MESVETPTAVIDRVASVLGAFDGQPLTLAQIARLSHVPRSSVHRILQHLVDLGWVERRDFEYSVGMRMFELGAQVVRQDSVHQAAAPILHDLHRVTGLTVLLSRRVGAEIVHVQRLGTWPCVRGWRVGARQPAVHTAAGRALLAQLDRTEWSALEVPAALTSSGIRSAGQLIRELHRVTERGGVAVDVQGSAAGTTVVAAAVGPPASSTRLASRPHAAVSLCGPVDEVQVDRAVAAVRGAAIDIWAAASGVVRFQPRSRRHHPSALARGAEAAVAQG